MLVFATLKHPVGYKLVSIHSELLPEKMLEFSYADAPACQTAVPVKASPNTGSKRSPLYRLYRVTL